MNKKDISFQLYTARNFQPYDKILNYFSDCGIVNIELFGLESINIENFRSIMEKFNITVKSSHFSFEALENPSNIIKRAKTLNIEYLIVPAPPVKGNEFKDQFSMTEDEWIIFGKNLSSYISIFEDSGLKLGYHNHSFEFRPLPTGKLPIECIMEQNENLKFEIDLGWTVAGKADPIFWIKKYASRIIACHLKDFSSPDKNLLDYDSQCAIGEGFIDWKSILNEIKNTNCKIFALEHDDPKDYKEYISKSLNFLSNLEV